MPKNLFGGKNAKKMANKKTGHEGSRGMPLPEEEGQYFARVTKRCGDGRFNVEYIADTNDRLLAGIARVPGSTRRISRNIREGSIIIFQDWGLSNNDIKGSVLHHYTDQEVVTLTQSGAIQLLLSEKDAMTTYEVEEKTTTAKDNEGDVLVVDDLELDDI